MDSKLVAQEIEDVARGGQLVETPRFDAKADLPAAKKNIDLAKERDRDGDRRRHPALGLARDEHGNPTVLTLVAEAPPSALDRYFYFEVPGHDSLFGYVVRSVLGIEPSRSEVSQLREALSEAA